MDIREINSIHDVLDSARYAADKFPDEEMWWRGQVNGPLWKLNPGVFRPRDGGVNYEQNVILRFIQKATTRYDKCPQDDDLPGWLFLMQHWGLPTRLLDWTESIMIATFFTVWQLPSEPASLWGLAPFRLNQNQVGKHEIFGTGTEDALSIFRNAFNASRPCDKKIIALSTRENDIRMMVQLSVFTIHGTPTPLDDLPDMEKFLIKFCIPASAKPTLKKELYIIGIRESNLFPDLAHLARDVASMKFGA